MAAATKERLAIFANLKAPTTATVLKASAKIFAGTVGVTISGKAQKYVLNTAGQTLLGIADRTYEETTAADVTFGVGDQMIFKRGLVGLLIDTTNPVGQAQLGKLVRLLDDQTVDNQAIGGDDLSVKLRKIEGGLAFCDVE